MLLHLICLAPQSQVIPGDVLCSASNACKVMIPKESTNHPPEMSGYYYTDKSLNGHEKCVIDVKYA